MFNYYFFCYFVEKFGEKQEKAVEKQLFLVDNYGEKQGLKSEQVNNYKMFFYFSTALTIFSTLFSLGSTRGFLTYPPSLLSTTNLLNYFIRVIIY